MSNEDGVEECLWLLSSSSKEEFKARLKANREEFEDRLNSGYYKCKNSDYPSSYISWYYTEVACINTFALHHIMPV